MTDLMKEILKSKPVRKLCAGLQICYLHVGIAETRQTHVYAR